ncbi:polysaccharide deacetylase family protein [Candidatus Electronema sp. TJ]|uniref:polysaccharide deacetylase family protein n=1 Tax=Candidatus Electronema sp. TJ TaxID=3401573 RepID=UPI003AA9BFEE
MPVSLAGSVGRNGKNFPSDVRLIFSLFNKILPAPLAVGDQCSADLIQAIFDFQKSFLSSPDGLIDVGGATWRKLTAATGHGSVIPPLLLSFDDGPAPTAALHSILNTLDAAGIKAEFYVLGKEVDSFPSAAKEIVQRGHRVQNHSYSHPNLASAAEAVVHSELEKTQDSIRKATGITPTKIRPPFGAGGWPPYDPQLAKVAASLSLKIENWDIDTEDWKSPKGTMDPAKLRMIKKQLDQRSGGRPLNVLMHIQNETADDLGRFISQLKAWGYVFAAP